MPSIPDLPPSSTNPTHPTSDSTPSSPKPELSSASKSENTKKRSLHSSPKLTDVAKSIMLAASSINVACESSLKVSILSKPTVHSIKKINASDRLGRALDSSTARTQSLWEKTSSNFSKISTLVSCTAVLIAVQTGDFESIRPALAAASLMEIPALIDKAGAVTNLCKNLHQIYSTAQKAMPSSNKTAPITEVTKALGILVANSHTSSAIASKRNNPSSKQ